MKSEHEELLTCKELAVLLKRHVSYVYAMRRAGFRMPGGTATLVEARQWLRRHRPAFRTEHCRRFVSSVCSACCSSEFSNQCEHSNDRGHKPHG